MKLRNKPASAAAQMVRHSQQGFTLIEIAIVLTIVGLIIGGIWVAASTVFNNNKAQALAKDVIQAVQNTKTLFSSQGTSASTVGVTVTNLINAGVFPTDMVTPNAGVLVTPFSTQSAVTDVTVSAAPGGTATSIGYAFNNLPSSACTQLLITLGSLNNIQKLGITGLNGGASPVAPAAGGLIAAPVGVTTSVTATAAAGACANAGNTNGVDVVFNVF